ncbi:tape measure protein [Sphingomonas faeni]|uniref:tape measure protein n=1 Tax=Sphingomonas faeni TaxID=185950 RepID=UPI0020C0EFD3|nr:tape measure protein [Sphingomonas faeni]MCK8457026.1 tape measure protein [Sphingomonas faeni]
MGSLSVAEIAVDLRAKYDKLDRELGTASSRVDRSLSAMEQRGSAFASKFSGALGAVSAGLLVAQLSKIADTSKQLDAQLRLATNGFGSFNKAQDDTRKIAASTRSSLEATTALYGNFARASQQTGRSQADAARATETFSKALKIGGADANAAASATLQFGQALASGALRGDEFNSIAEASPRIVKLIADSMGVTQGAVRKLAAEGKLTSDVLFRALTDPKFTASIDSDFKQLPSTFGEAMQQIENAAVITFGAFDKGGQFSNAIVNILADGTTSFAGLEDLARDFGVETRAIFDGLGNVFDPLTNGADFAFDNIIVKTRSVKEQIESLLGSFDRVGTAGANFANFLNAPGNYLRSFTGGQQVTVAPPSLRSNFRVASARSAEQAQARRVESQLADRFPGTNRDGSLNLTGNRQAPAVVRAPSAGGGRPSAARRTSAPKSPLNEDAFTRQEAQLNDRILRARGDEADTAEQRAAVEVARIEAQRVKNDDLIKGDKRITDVQRIRLTALTDLAAATEKAAVIRERDVAIEQRASAAIRRSAQSAEAGNRNEQDTLRSRLDLAKTANERKEIELRLLALAQQQERADQEQLIADRRRVLADKNTGPDARATATADIGDAERRLGTLKQTQPNERAAVEQRYASRGQQYADGFNADRLKEDIQGIEINGLESLNDGLADAITGAKSLGDVFHDVAGGIVRDLLRIAIQQAIIKPIANSLFGAGASGGGGGGFASIIGSIGTALAGGGSSSGLPRLANGGQIRAGGMGGVDKNVLSVNGVPRAMIGAHERLSVANPNLSSINTNARAARPSQHVTNHYSISVDAKNSVNPTGFARELSSVILAEAARMDGRTYKNAVRDTPGHMASYERLKS